MRNNFPGILFMTLCVILVLACQNGTPDQKALDTTEEPVDTISDEQLNFLLGHFNPVEHRDFVEIAEPHADRPGRLMHKEAYSAFIQMYDAAHLAGIDLKIISAARNFDYQKGLWEKKWTGQTKLSGGVDASVAFPDPIGRALKILEFSAMPGSSRHHWGTDIDVNSFENSWFESGKGLKLYNWLAENAAQFGFCQPYTKKTDARPHGYNEEKWHWSYVPLAKTLTLMAQKHMNDDLLTGFLGCEVSDSIGIVKNYVLGINKDCLLAFNHH